MKIKGVSIWIWLLGLIMIVGGYFVCAKPKQHEASELAQNCYQAAKEMITTERHEIIVRLSVDDDIELAPITPGKLTRAFDKQLSRLKESESVWFRESVKIEEWVSRGRKINEQLPKTPAKLRSMSEQQIEKNDKQWELFLEEDIVDVMKSK